jgi:ABC-type lipoprotein release transport system permease subunit
MVGGIASWFATRALVRLVDGVRPADAVTVAAMILLLTLAALFASFFPARRASRLSPIRALRQE